MSMNQFWFHASGVCKKRCEQFKVSKPQTGELYKADRAKCPICDIWISHEGCHLSGGSKVTADSEKWFCDCCHTQVERRIDKKTALRITVQKIQNAQEDFVDDEIDVDYCSNYRALLLKKLARSIPRKKEDFDKKKASVFGTINLNRWEVKEEFNCDITKLVDIAYSKSPNKISLIVDFEHIKHMIGHIPTREDLQVHSRFRVLQYEEKFGSLEQLLNRLGYDPWHRKNKIPNPQQKIPKKSYTKKIKSTSNRLHDVNNLNKFIETALAMIKSSPGGILIIDLCIKLDLTYEEMGYLSERLQRIDGITPDNGILIWRDIQSPKKPASKINPANDGIPELASRMLGEYRDGRSINKHLRQRLTQEYVACKSMAQVIRDNSNLREEEILMHVRTSLRLPPELKEMENQGGLHPNPDLSLRIALFAVNHYKWDGQNETEKDVVNLAKAISSHIVQAGSVHTGR